MITVKLRYGECVVLIQTDAELHPDVLDEMARRVVRVFVETQATLADADQSEGNDDDTIRGA